MSKFCLTVLLNFILFETCRSSGNISIFLSKYNNPGGKLVDGDECDWNLPVISDEACDHNFEVCVDQPNGSLTDMGQCSIGEYQTEHVANRNQIDFRQHTIRKNPKILPFNVWQGGFTLKVQVWDHDVSRKDGFVELLSRRISLNVSVSKKEGVKILVLHNRTKLTVEVIARCDDNWYGPRCDCHPSNDASGNYYCSSTTGDKNCQGNWFGPNCDVYCHTFQGHDCEENERKTCLKEMYGSKCKFYCKHSTDSNEHFNCRSGTKMMCPPGWEGVNCTVENKDDCTGEQCHSTTVHYPDSKPQTKTTTEGSEPASNKPSANDSGANKDKNSIPLIPIIAAVLTVIIITVVVIVIVWMMRQKKKKQGNRHNMENGQEQNDMALYDNPEAVNTQHVADDNIYYNVAGGPQNNNQNDEQVYEGPGTAATGDVYAVPDKRKLNRDPSKRNSTTSINSEVVLEDNEIYN